MSEIPEIARSRIDEMIKESIKNMNNIDPRLTHLLTQICYEMYKKGYQDAFRVINISNKKLEDLFK